MASCMQETLRNSSAHRMRLASVFTCQDSSLTNLQSSPSTSNAALKRTSREPWKASRRRLSICASAQTAAASVQGIGIQRPGLLDTAPLKHKLPGSSGIPSSEQMPRGWPPVTPSPHHHNQDDDPRRSIVKAAPRTSAAELSTAAQMARLSSLVYMPDPRDRLEALGLELRDCQQTPYTAFFVADGPSDLFSPQPQGKWRGKGRKTEGKTRYIISRGVAMDRKEVKWGDLWMKLLKFWPTEFEKGLTPHGTELLVHEGVKEIAEEVYRSLLPHLSFDPKRDGITAVRFGGHSLGGSLSLLLMLMFHLRSPVTRGWSSDVDFNSHTFGSFPVVASMPPFHLPWDSQVDNGGSSKGAAFNSADHSATCPLMRALDSLRNQLKGVDPGLQLQPSSCSVLSDLGLPAGAARGFVLDSDIVPRAFMALKQDAVKGLLQLREKVTGSSWSGRGMGHPLSFQPVGTVHYMQSQGERVDVAKMMPLLAEAALHVELEDFLRNPQLLMKGIHDHYFNHYVTGLEAALASALLDGGSFSQH